jgi:hypothetical protein
MTATTLDPDADGVLVVEEGAARLRWLGRGADWRLVGLWPDAAEQRALAEKVKAGQPLLIVLGTMTSVVPVWRSELQMPEQSFESVHTEGDLMELTMPFPEWLPDSLRERGQQFSEHARQVMRRTPSPLLPTLIVEEPVESGCPVRFAQRTRSPVTAEDLSRAASWVFSPTLAA